MNLEQLKKEMTNWRQHLHQHPEFGFEEKNTSAFVTKKLQEFGFEEVVQGIGGTGVVATLTRGSSPRAIALRADMDALKIQEQTNVGYQSRNPGLMHACGHDGHTAMLLGAAKILASEGKFDGTVRFIFQPAEEWGRGALAMLSDGLMQRFSFEEIYGIHNLPGLAIGKFQTRAGTLMASEDNFEIILRGDGGHSARPHISTEVMVAACSLVVNLQSIVARHLNPTDTAVVSVTELITDGTRNVLPGLARILGDARSFHSDVSAKIEEQMRHIAAGTAQSFNLDCEVNYTREFIPLINDVALTEAALHAAQTVVGKSNISLANEPITVSEDFAQFLQLVPGCFVFAGNGENSAPLHNPNYNFNDEGLLCGAQFFVEIVNQRLGRM